MFELTKKIPNVPFVEDGGRRRETGEFDQKTHAALLNLTLTETEREPIRAEIASRKKTWDWLGVQVLILDAPITDAPEGLLAIDRFGRLIAVLSPGPDLWDRLEKEFLYYEARHC